MTVVKRRARTWTSPFVRGRVIDHYSRTPKLILSAVIASHRWLQPDPAAMTNCGGVPMMTAAAGPLAQPLRQGASPRQRSGGEWTGVDRSHGFEQFGRQLDRDRRHPRRGGHHRNAGRNGAARARSGKQCQRCGPGRRAAHRPTAVLHAEKPAGEHEAHGDQRSETTRAGRPRAPWRANSAPEFPPGRRARSRDLGRRRTTRRRSTQPVAAGQHRISIRTSCRPCSACCWPATHRPGYPPQLPRRCGARSDRWVRPNGSANRSLAAWRPGGRDPVSGRPAQEQREGDRRTRQGLGQHTHPDVGTARSPPDG